MPELARPLTEEQLRTRLAEQVIPKLDTTISRLDTLIAGTGSLLNLLTNPGFETGAISPWETEGAVTIIEDPELAYEGSYCVRLYRSGAGVTSVGQGVDASSGRMLALCYFIVSSAGSGTGCVFYVRGKRGLADVDGFVYLWEKYTAPEPRPRPPPIADYSIESSPSWVPAVAVVEHTPDDTGTASVGMRIECPVGGSADMLVDAFLLSSVGRYGARIGSLYAWGQDIGADYRYVIPLQLRYAKRLNIRFRADTAGTVTFDAWEGVNVVDSESFSLAANETIVMDMVELFGNTADFVTLVYDAAAKHYVYAVVEL